MEILFPIGAVLPGLVIVVSLIERRVRTQGVLFTGQTSRRLALLLGLLFGGIALFEMNNSGSIHLEFIFLAIALIGYSLGVGRLQELRK
jgi:hypothetical protein